MDCIRTRSDDVDDVKWKLTEPLREVQEENIAGRDLDFSEVFLKFREETHILTGLHTLVPKVRIPVRACIRNATWKLRRRQDDCRLTMIPRRPLAPPPRSAALRQISSKAALLKRISTPE